MFRVPFTLKIRNITLAAIEELEIILLDSTSSVLKEAMKTRSLSELEMAELEYFLYERPAFEITDRRVSPTDSDIEICVEAHGKRGLTYGVIEVAHGFPRMGIPQSHLELKFSVMVNATIELITFDVIPIGIDSSQYILVLEFRNAWIKPLDLSLSLAGGSTLIKSFHTGQVQRIPVILSQILL